MLINRILLHNNYFHIELFKLFFSFQRIPKFNFGIIKFLLKKIKNLTTLLVVQVIFCPIRLNCFEISGQGWLNFPYIYTHTRMLFACNLLDFESRGITVVQIATRKRTRNSAANSLGGAQSGPRSPWHDTYARNSPRVGVGDERLEKNPATDSSPFPFFFFFLFFFFFN